MEFPFSLVFELNASVIPFQDFLRTLAQNSKTFQIPTRFSCFDAGFLNFSPYFVMMGNYVLFNTKSFVIQGLKD